MHVQFLQQFGDQQLLCLASGTRTAFSKTYSDCSRLVQAGCIQDPS